MEKEKSNINYKTTYKIWRDYFNIVKYYYKQGIYCIDLDYPTCLTDKEYNLFVSYMKDNYVVVSIKDNNITLKVNRYNK